MTIHCDKCWYDWWLWLVLVWLFIVTSVDMIGDCDWLWQVLIWLVIVTGTGMTVHCDKCRCDSLLWQVLVCLFICDSSWYGCFLLQVLYAGWLGQGFVFVFVTDIGMTVYCDNGWYNYLLWQVTVWLLVVTGVGIPGHCHRGWCACSFVTGVGITLHCGQAWLLILTGIDVIVHCDSGWIDFHRDGCQYYCSLQLVLLWLFIMIGVCRIVLCGRYVCSLWQLLMRLVIKACFSVTVHGDRRWYDTVYISVKIVWLCGSCA